MKILGILSLLLIIPFSGFSGPDTSAYYAASRLDYYTNEEVGEVMVFIPERLNGYKITIDLVFEHEFLNRGYVVLPGEVFPVPFSLKALREGQNEVTVSFYENDKWMDSRKVWVSVRPHSDNAVKIDLATGGLVVSGLPFLPFGFLYSFPVDQKLVDYEIAKGFNQISPNHQIEKKSLKGRKAYMRRFADLGIRVNYNLCNLINKKSIDGGVAAILENVRKEVELFRNHPALLTWYLACNPDTYGINPDSLIKIYDLVRELDPYHPVSMLISSPRLVKDYKDAMDIVMTAPYPVPQGNLNEVKDYTKIPKTEYWLQKPVWILAQTIGGSLWRKREPTPPEVRVMTYMALIHGVTGIQYTREGLSLPKSPATWDECGKMALEFAELAPDILSPHPAPEILIEDESIYARAWNQAGMVTIAVVNEKNEPAHFKLQMKDVDITISAEVMFENRKINILKGGFEDMIDGYGTRVYRFDARKKTVPVSVFEPGNLTIDPGFEDMSNVGIPAACYAYPGEDAGNTYFIDSRSYFEGEHSLRMNNPIQKPGVALSFYGINLASDKSYTISIMARTGRSSNRQDTKKGEPVRFRLALDQTERIFICTDSWKKYEINGVRLNTHDQDTNEFHRYFRSMEKELFGLI